MTFQPEWPDISKTSRAGCLANIIAESGGNLDKAVAVYERALTFGDDPIVWRNLARIHMHAKRWDEAEECLKKGRSPFWLAYYYEWTSQYDKAWETIKQEPPSPSQAHLMGRIARFVGKHREGIEALRPFNNVNCLFERTLLHDKIGQYAEAWRTAEQANAGLGLSDASPFPDRTYDLPAEDNPERPIFIVGMPRTGTTLMERMIAQHPEVTTKDECEYFQDVDRRLRDGERLCDIGRGYLLHDPGRTVDKNPLNFQYVDLIRAVFPDAVILRMIRDRDDTAVSCFFRNFRGQFSWSTSWNDIHGAIDRCDAMLAGKDVHDVHYEDLVRTPEPVLRAVLERCGLTWHQGCLDHTADTTYHKGSYEEVRKPLNTAPIGRADHYRPFFDPSPEPATTSV